MLKIRLQRVGRKHEPTFRLVLTDSKNSTKSGRFEEVLGSYDPRKMTEAFKADRIKHWLSQGAGLTGSVNNLLVKHGIIRGKKVHVGSDFAPKVVEAVEEEAPQASSDNVTEQAVETSNNVEEVPAAESAETPTTPEVQVESSPIEESAEEKAS